MKTTEECANINDVENQTEKQAEEDLLAPYVKELKEDVEITVHNIREKAMMSSSIRSKWLNYYFVEKKNREKLRKVREEILKSYAKKDGFSDSVIKIKSEQALAKNDPRIAQIDLLTAQNKAVIEYIEMAMNILNDFGYSVKNAIEVLKLERM